MRNLIRYLFLVKEIRSREGVLHFRRWRLLQTPWFGIYIHYIAESDKDKHPHSHPWDFINIILRGGYSEEVTKLAFVEDIMHFRIFVYQKTFSRIRGFLSCGYNYHGDYHKITLGSVPTWSLVFVGPHKHEWGYLTETGSVTNQEYRKVNNDYRR